MMNDANGLQNVNVQSEGTKLMSDIAADVVTDVAADADEVLNNESAAESPAEIKEFLNELTAFIKATKPSKGDIAKQKVVLCRKLGIKRIPTDIELFLNSEEKDLNFVREFLQTKPMRTKSGVAVIAVMSAPAKCPHGKCIYCPGGIDSSFGSVPQSYTGNEPATMRGIRNEYDGYRQVMNRLEQYVAIGQSPEKIELIILGGTFISMPECYRDDFVRDTYQAMNNFSEEFYRGGIFDIVKFKNFFELPGDIRNANRTVSIQSKLKLLKEKNKQSLQDAMNFNETSNIRCVGLTIETKPDFGMLEHGNKMLKYGCTRVELGIQTLDDALLKKINRGHTLAQSRQCIKELKNLGFKLNFHMMPGLPGSSKDKDIQEFRELFENEDYRPDMLKIYPTMVMPGTILSEMLRKGQYNPLKLDEAVEIISEALRYVPRYCRVMRIQRDIPAKFADAAISQNNLRQFVSKAVSDKNFKEQDIKAREIGNRTIVEPIDFDIISYDSSGGKEFFISLIDAEDQLLGFARLRLPSQMLREEIDENTSIIRELHVYGKSLPLKNETEDKDIQHRGFGKMLMAKAEEISAEQGKKKLIVISGVGVRQYYRKIGYFRDGPYVAKMLK